MTKTRFGTASWKKIDDNTLEEIDKVKGNVESKTTWTLSSDGKTLTAHVTGDKPGGGSFDDTVYFMCESPERMVSREHGRTRSSRAVRRVLSR